ncbi:MAG: propionyl-CoA carboxylase beta chain [Chloroflexi bacterium]|nr:MAG: propionyl-CoA carboxylase beta chain [Chloroflexota bacterium]
MTLARAESGAAELELRRTIAAGLGGPERIQRQHDRGFLTARERVALLLDPGTNVPFGPLVNSGVPGEEHRTMGDGQLMGFGKVDGRWVAYSASDATIKGASGGAGSMRRGGAFSRIVSAAGLPKIGLMQGGGARITDIVSSRFSGFPGPSTMGRHQGFPRRGALLTAVMGNYYAPWTVADADFRLMTEASNFSISSPPIVEEATGEVVTPFELGGRDIHAKVTGEIDNIVDDDAAAVAQLRRVFSYFPANAWEQPPVVRTGDPPERIEASLRDLVPEKPQRPFNVKKAINAVMDQDSFIEWMPDYAKQLVCGIARLDGHTVCVIGNQPSVRAGSLDVKSSIKLRRMMRVAQALRCATVSFIDVPGVLPTVEEEHQRLLQGIIDMFSERNALSQPTIGVHMRKGYGAAVWAMHGADPEWYSFAWPSAQIAFVGPEPGVRVAFRKEWQASEDQEAFVEQHAKVIRKNSEPWLGAQMDFMDDVIDPAATRPIVICALATARARVRNSEQQRGWERPHA